MSTITRSRLRSRVVGILTLIAAVCLAPTGCNILGPAAYLIGGLPQIEAEHDLQERPTVVFVDDRANVIMANALTMRVAIAEKCASDLMVKGVLSEETAISSRDALAMVGRQDRHSSLMAIDEIGAEVGAEQVIFVEMLQFTLSQDGVTPRPAAQCRVRVIDVVNKKRLYPGPQSDEPARLVFASIREVDPALFRSASSRLQVYRALADELGEAVAKLFYRHESRDLGGNLQPR